MKLHRNEKYIKWGMTALAVIAAGILCWIIMSNFPGFYGALMDLSSILAPVLYGCLFAYMMNPVMEFVSKRLTKLLSKTKLSEKRVGSVSKVLGVVSALIALLGVIYALIALIIPNIVESLQELLTPQKLEGYYSTISRWISNTFAGSPVEDWFRDNFDQVIEYAKKWLLELDILSIVSDVFSAGMSVISTLFNFILGIVAAVYILIYKKELCAQAKKLTITVMRSDHADRVFELARRTNRIFSGYVIGKLLDAIFVGVTTYAAALIMDLPYAILIAAIVGVTNIIPYFGPFIGGAPCALLLLIESPMDALYFILFIVVLQMIDGNIIENRIMGVQLGISDFWVLVAILLFGGIFGFIGMLLGVPVFAVIYSLISDAVNKKLRRKRYPVETDIYYKMQSVGDLPVTKTHDVSCITVEPSYDLKYEPEDDLPDDFD